MQFLLVSRDGDGLGIARRLVEEGHDVEVNIKNAKVKTDYDGLLRKRADLKGPISRDTIIFFDSTGGGKTAERLRGQGYLVAFGSMFADQMELDRPLAFGLMEEAGIQVPPSQHFSDWQSGINYALTRDRLCFKSNDNKIDSYLASSPEDMMEYLRSQEKDGEAADYELQDFVKGLEISTEVWFDGVDIARPLNHTFERKQLMNDNLGPSSGCAGNVVWACQDENCRICQDGVLRMVPLLRHHGYRGPLDLNAIVTDEGVWGLEFTPRFGFDAFPALLEMLTDELGDLINRYARGARVSEFPMRREGCGAGLRVTIPPYPYEEGDVEAPRGVAIRGLVRSDRMHSYFYNVFLDEEGVLRSSGAFGAIGVFTGFGDDLCAAMARCEEIAKRAEIRDKQYRTDLSHEFLESYEKYQQQTIKKEYPDPLPSSAASDLPVHLQEAVNR